MNKYEVGQKVRLAPLPEFDIPEQQGLVQGIEGELYMVEVLPEFRCEGDIDGLTEVVEEDILGLVEG